MDLPIARRSFLGGAALVLLAGCGGRMEGIAQMDELYGLIGEIKAQPGKGSDLLALLADADESMPGNLAYLVAANVENADSIWITEVWRSKADHAASLNLPSVQRLIARARPLIAGFGTRVETRPLAPRR